MKTTSTNSLCACVDIGVLFCSPFTRCKGGGELVVESRDGRGGGAAEGAVGGEPVLGRRDLREAVPGLLPPLHDRSRSPGEAGAGTKGEVRFTALQKVLFECLG